MQQNLLTYKELLKELENSDSNHLLLGNGFNNSLGIKTSYPEIFSRMKNEYTGYENVEDYLNEQKHDIEKLIGHLKDQIKSTGNNFLEEYIERKVKLDFMNATNEIVQERIGKVYQENNQGIYLLLKNFTTYFTLNYDPSLYLLLMKFKKDEDGEVLAIQHTTLFQEEDLNARQNNIYAEIKAARKSGNINIYITRYPLPVNLKETKKGRFVSTIKIYNDKAQMGWRGKDIDKVCNMIWKEENNQPELYINDGYQSGLFTNSVDQNLYFLHGAFHIIINKKVIQKITAKQNKSFCEKLNDAIHDKDKDIVCVLTNESAEKRNQINENSYLSKCFESLSRIEGSLVILGSSLEKNDKHIIDQINKSGITQIYISSCDSKRNKIFQQARSLFKDKEISLFDYNTISYKNENNQ